MHKPRIQSPLDLLPLHVKQALWGWLTTGGARGSGMTYSEAKQRLRAEYGIATSVSALCGFYQRSHHAFAPGLDAAVQAKVQPDGKTVTITVTLQFVQPSPATIACIRPGRTTATTT